MIKISEETVQLMREAISLAKDELVKQKETISRLENNVEFYKSLSEARLAIILLLEKDLSKKLLDSAETPTTKPIPKRNYSRRTGVN